MRRKKEIIILIALFLLVAVNILPREYNNLDEIWNYNFAKNIAEGRVPYKDFNMVQTPLSAIIAGVMLKIFGNELIVMRTLGIVLCTAILYILYKILDKLKVDRTITYLFIMLILILHKDLFIYDYNYLVQLITLIIIYFEIESNVQEYDIKKDLLLGILAGTSILAKQTTGIILATVFIFYSILTIKRKEQIKNISIKVLIRALGTIIPLIILFIYLLANNAINEFLNYTVFGIRKFSNYISYTYLFRKDEKAIAILAIVVPIIIMYMYYRAIIKEKHNNELVLFVYSVASITGIYPISDKIHFAISILPTLICIPYILNSMVANVNYKGKIIERIKDIINIFIIFIVLLSIVNITKYLMRLRETEKNINHFKYIIKEDDFEIEKTDAFIKEAEKLGYKTYILDARAATFMIPIDKYNKDYDMFLKGNLGVKDFKTIIENLEQEENIIVLVTTEREDENWQSPTEVTDYIRKNWKNIGTVHMYNAYVNKGE